MTDSTHDPVALLERIRELECELASQWKHLAEGSRDATDERIHALEITVAGQPYLVPTDSIREVVRMARPQPLVDAPEWVFGVVPYGSKTVPLVDLGLRLEKRPTEVRAELFVVITDKPQWLGLVVEGVGRVTELDPEALATPGPELPCAPFLLGVYRGSEGMGVSLLSVGMTRDYSTILLMTIRLPTIPLIPPTNPPSSPTP